MKLFLAASALVVVAAGCDGCRKVPQDCTDVFGQFEGVDDGAKITAADDVDSTTAGVQVNLSVLALDQCNNKVDIQSATIEQSDTKNVDFRPGPDGAIKGNRVTFNGVTLPVGLNTVRVTFFTERSDVAEQVSITLNVYDSNARPVVASVKFAGDVNDDGILNAAELPNGQTPVANVEVGNLEDGQPVEIRDRVSGQVFGVAPLMGTSASVTLDKLPSKNAGKYDLVAHVANSKGLENQITKCMPDDPADPCNTAAFRQLTIDVTPPTLLILSPSAADNLFGPAQDADPMKPGFQLTVSATASLPEDVLPDVTIDISGQPTITVQHSNGSILATLDLPASGTNMYLLTVTAHDAAGNPAVGTRTFSVDYDPPTINITSPVASGGPYTDFKQTFCADLGGVSDGATVHVFTRPAGSMQKNFLGDVTAQAGKACGDFTFPGGNLDIIADVEDAAGNPASDTEANVSIQGKGCSIQVNAPTLLMSSNDKDPTTQGLQFDIAGVSNNCPNNPVFVFIGPSMTPVTGTTDAMGNFAITVTLAEGGPTAVNVSMTDAFGATNSVTTNVTVDLTPPTLTLPVNNAVFNALNDQQELQAGSQTNLAYNPAKTAGTRIDVCSTNPANGPTPCPDGASGWFLVAKDAPNQTAGFTFLDGTAGAYQVKLVEVTDPVLTGFNVTPAVSITVDTVRPVITSFTVAGDANGDDCLNATESPSGVPTAQVTASEPIVSAVLKDPMTMTQVASGGTSANTGTIPITPAAMANESDFNLVAVVSDAAGNTNVVVNPTPANPLNTAAFKQPFRLDRVAPTTALQAPTKNELGLADDADGSSSNGNFQLHLAAVTALDVGNSGVDITVSGVTAPPKQTPNASGQVALDVALPPTGTTTHTISVSATDKCGNVGAAATKTLTVDRDPPTIVFVSPKASNGPYGTYNQTTTAQVTGAPGATVHVFTKVGNGAEVEIGTLTVDNTGLATGTITYPNGTQTIRFEVSDSAGNVATVSEPNVVVNGVGCSVLINTPTGSPALLNTSNDGNPSTPTTYEGVLTGTSSNCAGQQAWLYRGTGASRVLLSGPVTADSSGNFSLNYSLAEGSWTLEAEMDNGAGIKTPVDKSVIVDLTPPSVTNVSPTGATLFFVSASNSHLIPAPQPGYVADGSPGGDAEVNVTLTVTGGVGGSAVVTYNGATVGGPASITTSPQTLSIPTVLTHNTVGSFVIKVVDSGGNTVAQTSNATVDVIPPDAPVVTQGVASGQERAAKVNLSWTATFDDASDSTSGPHQGYDIRWTTNAVNEPGITSDADYFSATLVKKEPVVAAGTTTKQLSVPPLATYFISVRAFDEVGNYSPFAAPTPLNNFWTTASFTNPSMTAAQFYGFNVVSHGTIDPGTADDLVVSSQSDGPGAVYIYWGGSNFTTAAPQKIVPPASPPSPNNDNAGQLFGQDVSVGKTSDTTNDILVGSPGWSRPTGTPAYGANTGRAFLYFGGSNPVDTSTFVEFRGNSSSILGATAEIVDDINGDTFSDIVFSANAELSGQGRVYIFYGRPKGDATTVGSWLYLQAQSGGFVPMTAANVVIEGPTPAATTGGGNQFGRNRWGVASLGNIDGAGPGEFTIPDSQDTVNKVFVFAGQTRLITAPQLTLKTGNTPTPNDALQTLSQGTPGTGARFGFGQCAVGGRNFLGGSATDLVVADSYLNTVYVFPDGNASGYGASAQTITGNFFFGQSCAGSDLNGDGQQDLALGQATTPNGSLFIFYNKGSSPQFDATAGAGFAQSRLKGPKELGISVSIGDFNGDGKPDIASGDHVDGPGKVTVWF